MLRVLIVCLAFVLPAVPALAQDGAGTPEPAIESVIRNQLDAFLADDFATAFTFASPTIKGMFRTPETFGRMVRQGYPMVWRPADVRFLELRERAGRTVQTVMITDGAGTVHLLAYEMLLTPDGWQINGVALLRQPETGV